MNAQVWILSSDALFSRMLMLELKMQRLDVVCAASLEGAQYADVVLLDLDSALPPPRNRYREMIGFSRNAIASGDEIGRRCSLILRRPFEMKRLRDEVLSLISEDLQKPAVRKPTDREVQADGDADGWIQLPDGGRIRLSPKEYAVFRLLAEHRGTPVSRERISEEIGESMANKVDVYVCLLRKKLETADTRLIKTIRGKGYCMLNGGKYDIGG